MGAHLTYRRGDTFTRTTTLYDVDGGVYDLTGTTVWFTIKDTTDVAAGDDESELAAWWDDGGTSGGITVTDPTTGAIRIAVPAADLIGLKANRVYLWDIQVDDGSGKLKTVDVGTLGVLADVTIRATPGVPVAP